MRKGGVWDGQGQRGLVGAGEGIEREGVGWGQPAPPTCCFGGNNEKGENAFKQ